MKQYFENRLGVKKYFIIEKGIIDDKDGSKSMKIDVVAQ